MIKIQSVKVYNLASAIKSTGISYQTTFNDPTAINEKDLRRANRLSTKGEGEDKFLRFVTVTFTLTASKYFWSEFDTYHFVERNSQGTLRCIRNLDLDSVKDSYVDTVIWERFKRLVHEYKNNPSEENRYILRSSLPEGFALTSTISTNYNTLKHMYKLRHNHVLREWRIFCNDFISNLPGAKLLAISDIHDLLNNEDFINATKDQFKDYYDLSELVISDI